VCGKSTSQHSPINVLELKSVLPSEAEHRVLKCARKIRELWGAQNEDTNSPVPRLADADIDAFKAKHMSMRDAYGTPPGAESPRILLHKEDNRFRDEVRVP
jgi:hypothetical protein